MSVREKIDTILNDLKSKPHLNDKDKREFYCMETYPDIYEEFPFLVKKLCKMDNLDMLYIMLDKIDQIKDGKVSQTQVELDLGKQLADKYLPQDKPKND